MNNLPCSSSDQSDEDDSFANDSFNVKLLQMKYVKIFYKKKARSKEPSTTDASESTEVEAINSSLSSLLFATTLNFIGYVRDTIRSIASL